MTWSTILDFCSEITELTKNKNTAVPRIKS